MSKRRIAQRKTENQPRKKEPTKTAVPAATGWNSMTNWLVVLAFVLPILFSRATLDPTITSRYIFLSSFVLLFVLFFYVRKKINFVLATRVKIVFALGIAFGVWSILSSFTAINPSPAYYEVSRHFLNLILLFIVFVIVQKEDAQLLKICKAVLLMSLIQSLVGIMQFYEVAFDDLPGANAKPYGLMANRNLFGSAQALVLPFVIYVLYKGGKTWKYTAMIAMTGILASILISQTRSAWIATVIMMLVSLALVIIFSKPNRKNWIIGSLIITVFVTAFVILVLTGNKESELSKSIKERTSLSGKTSESVSTNERVKIWGKTIELIKDHPIIGVGTGNWKLSIQKYGSEGLAWARGFYVPDRPHNVYLHISAETGFPGALFYFGMWIGIVIIAFKIITRKDQTEDRRILIILMLSGLGAFATDCMFSFPAERIEHSLYITLMAGIILGTYINSGRKEEKKQTGIRILPLIMTLIIAFNLFIGIKKFTFEKYMNLAKAYYKENRYQEAIEHVEEGKSDFVTTDEEGKPLQIYSSLAYRELKDYENALKESNTAKKYNPNSAMVYNNMGIIYTDMGDFKKAIEIYNKALKIAPDMDIALKNLAVNYFNLGNYQGVIQTLNKIQKNDPDSSYLNSLLNEAKRRVTSQIK